MEGVQVSTIGQGCEILFRACHVGLYQLRHLAERIHSLAELTHAQEEQNNIKWQFYPLSQKMFITAI